MSWEISFKAIGTLLSVVVAFLQLRSFIQASHSTLKTDLEILNLLSASNPKHLSDPNYQAVKAYVDDRITRLYPSKKRDGPGKSKLYRDQDFIKGILIFVFFFSITLYLLKDGFSLLSLLPAVVALTGLGGVIGALQRRNSSRGKKKGSPEPS